MGKQITIYNLQILKTEKKTFVWFSIDLDSLKGNIAAKFQYCDRIHRDRAQIVCIGSVSARVRRKSWDESNKLITVTDGLLELCGLTTFCQFHCVTGRVLVV